MEIYGQAALCVATGLATVGNPPHKSVQNVFTALITLPVSSHVR
jgi:hypothetical protein